MTKRSLAARILAAALCLSIPYSCTAAQFQGEAPQIARAGAVMPAAQVYATPSQLRQALDVHFPAGFTPEAALASLSAAIAAPASAAAVSDVAAARALASAIASPGGERAAAVAAALPAAQRKRLAAAQVEVHLAATGDPAFQEALARLRAAAETPVAARAASRLPGVLERAKQLFRLDRADLIAVPGGPGSLMPGMPGSVGLMPANFQGGQSAKRTGPRPTVPVSQRVTTLNELLKNDPAAALAEASAILSDGAGADARIEVRVAAIRALGQLSIGGAAPILTKAAGEPFGWYERREAAHQLGLRAGDLQGEPRAAAVKALEAAAQGRNASLRLMAGWSLERFGVDAAPLMEKGEKLEKQLSDAAKASVPSMDTFRDLQVSSLNRNEPPQKPKGPSVVKRLAIWAAVMALLMVVFNGVSHRPSAAPAAEPAAITQVQAGQGGQASAASADAAIQDADQAVQQADKELDALAAQTAPKTPNQQIADSSERTAKAMEQITQNTARTANAMEQLAKNTAPKPQGSALGGMIMNILLWVGVMFGITWLIRKMQGGGAGAFKGQMSQVKNKFERPDVTFDDVAGIDDARAEIEEIADYLHNPEKYAKLGARVPKGVLLDGPPGTGKTLLARALAGESGANFISVSGSDFIEMFVGVGASRVRQLFAQAKANKPAIIFIDELDAVAKKRDGGKLPSGGNDEREQTINAILAEMSGFEDSSGVIVMAATNRADVLDPAITRPGRFDRKIHVGLPDVLGREAILQVHARKARLGADVDLQFIAKRTAGLSGAFLEGIINEAALLAARRGAAEISQADLNEGVDRATIGAKRNLFMAPATKRRVAFHESGHVIAGMLSGGVPPNKVTVIPHGSAALGFAEPGGQEDNYLYIQPELENRLVGILGGLAAEEIVFGNTSTGPDNDLEQATRIARGMVERWGMSRTAGYAQTSANEYGQRQISEQTAREVDLEVKRIVGEAKRKAVELLTARRDALDQMAKELLERETLSGEDAQRIVGPASK